MKSLKVFIHVVMFIFSHYSFSSSFDKLKLMQDLF
jgi:hypothetical protein